MKLLVNPKTKNYQYLKEIVFSGSFPWFWMEDSTTLDLEYDRNKYSNISVYTHTFLTRPEVNGMYSVPSCDYLDLVCTVFKEILMWNGISFHSFIRINANCVHPHEKVLNSVPHTDHNFSHHNIIIYLNDSDGATVVEGEEYIPVEDEVLLFDGVHFLRIPSKGRRINCVATFI